MGLTLNLQAKFILMVSVLVSSANTLEMINLYFAKPHLSRDGAHMVDFVKVSV